LPLEKKKLFVRKEGSWKKEQQQKKKKMRIRAEIMDNACVYVWELMKRVSDRSCTRRII
jgi:hypothetical protein